MIRIARLLLGSTVLLACAVSLAAPKAPARTAPRKPASTAATALLPLAKVLYHEALLGEVGWSLRFKVGDSPRPLTAPKDAHQAFERFLSSTTVPSASLQAEKARLRALRSQVAKLFGEALTRVGEEPLQFCSGDNLLPVRVAQLSDGQALLVGSVVLNDVYNTQDSTVSSRVTQVAKKTSLPLLRRMHNSLKSTSIPYLGCVVTYGSKDFSDESPTLVSLKGEVLGLVVSQAELRKLAAAQTTEDAVLKRSQVYVRERGTYAMKKVVASPE